MDDDLRIFVSKESSQGLTDPAVEPVTRITMSFKRTLQEFPADSWLEYSLNDCA
jgi:hypothetical protein